MSPATLTDETPTPQQLDDWDRDGFLVFDRFLEPDTLTALRAAYDDVLSGRVTASGDRRLGELTRQVMRPSRDHATFDRNAAVDAALRIGRRLLGAEEVVRKFDMLIYKPAGHTHATPWHQDMAYDATPFAAPGTTHQLTSVQFWIPLDDVDDENGCMQFAAGYHTEPLLEHHVASGDPDDDGRLLAIVDPDTQIDASRIVVAEIPAGGATVHSYGTVHYTGPNRSADRPRRSYIVNVAVRSS